MSIRTPRDPHRGLALLGGLTLALLLGSCATADERVEIRTVHGQGFKLLVKDD